MKNFELVPFSLVAQSYRRIVSTIISVKPSFQHQSQVAFHDMDRGMGFVCPTANASWSTTKAVLAIRVANAMKHGEVV